MKRVLPILLVLAIVIASLQAAVAQPQSALTQSVDRIFERSARYLVFVNKVTKPLSKAVEEERDLYSTLSGSYDHLAVSEFVKEAAELQQGFQAMVLPQSKTDKRRIYAELKAKADYLQTVQRAIYEAKKSAQWFSENVPQPKMVSVGVVENLWLEEFPAAGKAVARLHSSITARMREIEREVDIKAEPSADGEDSGPFSLFNLEESIPRLEEKVWGLLDQADSAKADSLDTAISKLDDAYHEMRSDFRSVNEYIKTLQTAKEALPESDRLLREKYDSSIADAVEYQKALMKHGSELLRKKRELEGKKPQAEPTPQTTTPAAGSSPPPGEKGASIDARKSGELAASQAIRAQEAQLEELRWQATYDRYQANLRASIGQNRAQWQAVNQALANTRAGREAYLGSFATQTFNRGRSGLEQQVEQGRQRLAATLQNLDPAIQSRLQQSGIDKWQAQEQAAWAEAVAYGKAQAEQRSSTMVDKAMGAASGEFANQALTGADSDAEEAPETPSEAPAAQEPAKAPRLIPKRQDSAPPAPRNLDGGNLDGGRPDLFSRSREFDFRPSWDEPVRGAHVQFYNETGSGELHMGVSGSAREIDLLRPFFQNNPQAVRDLIRENPDIAKELQGDTAGTSPTAVRERGWYDFVKENLFGSDK
ncbi:MAG: hypothetical protein KDD69_04170 [Bdellovibrionales bacterium]|nr:hypothetical protein [Bdellovibrionales bacterium]